MCGINAVGAQGSGCMFTLCHAPLKMAVLLHKTGNVCRVMITAVCKIAKQKPALTQGNMVSLVKLISAKSQLTQFSLSSLTEGRFGCTKQKQMRQTSPIL